ncbi:MAG TPA: exodeoxyribonuclease V subunit alpha [Polyangia bacterium]|nr:exodeoxyribonuclease V subunit alpha [Polyangia bacterium]
MIADLESLAAAGWFSALDVAFARALARLAGDKDPLVALGAAEASRAVAAGHVCADLAHLGGRPVPLEDPEAEVRWPAAARWRASLITSPAVGDGSVPTPLVLDAASRLYLHRYWRYERELAKTLLARAAAPPAPSTGPPSLSPLTADLERLFPAPADPALDLDGLGTADQRAAARSALEHRFAAIDGGPGTGKTTAVARILALLAERAMAADTEPPRVALLAPTGKAAARLAESLRDALEPGGPGSIATSPAVRDALPREASTIHRALGWSPAAGGFRHDAANPLAADVVVVDETSMVDLALLARLVAAVPPAARLILLGDRDQLASVEAGAVFGDICGDQRAPSGEAGLADCVTQLRHSFRFGAGIRDLAAAINAGDPDLALAVLDDPAFPEVSLIEVEGDREQSARAVALAAEGFSDLFLPTLPQERLAALGRFRLLAAHRRGWNGAERLNREVERASALRRGSLPGAEWYAGRPVMITLSERDLGLHNGDTGVATLGDDGRMGVVFPGPGGTRWVPSGRLPRHETAFATTVHKAQGSEFDEVLVVLPLRPSPVLSRELLYTAVTRARSKVAICASREAVRRAVATPIRRSSGLRDALWGVG